MGIGSYITAPLWLTFLAASVLISVQARFVRPDYFPAGRSLFPFVLGDNPKEPLVTDNPNVGDFVD
jgi:membrane glycosyltransferase